MKTRTSHRLANSAKSSIMIRSPATSSSRLSIVRGSLHVPRHEIAMVATNAYCPERGTSEVTQLKRIAGAQVIHYTLGADYNEDNILEFNPEIFNREAVTAPNGFPPIVVLPGFGNQTTDYIEPFAGRGRDGSLLSNLEERGFTAYVVPLVRKDWFKIAWGLISPGFWSAKNTTGYTWYIDRVHATVQRALSDTGADQVILVGHSAGGWLARAYLSDPKYQDKSDSLRPTSPWGSSAAPRRTPNPKVRALVTLGTPQRPPPSEGDIRDVTGGALSYVDREFPGAWFAADGVAYVAVTGRAVRGYRVPKEEARSLQTYASGSYEQVGGVGDLVEGDCVVPNSYAVLPGADANLLLDGVFHSMSRVGSYDDYTPNRWYGSAEVVDTWLSHMVDSVAGRGASGSYALSMASGDEELAAVGVGAEA